MIEGTPQDQISQPPEHQQGSPSSIPLDAMSADQLPREKGIQYDEVARIVGSLYLDSHMHVSKLEDQFQAVSEEYQTKVLQLQAQVGAASQEIDRLNKRVATLNRELEARNERAPAGHASPSGRDRGDEMHDNP